LRSTGNQLLRSLERRLRERHAELEDRLAGLTPAPERGSGISFGKRVGDGTTEAVSRLNDVGVVDSLKASVERVERTLAKLAEGTYGTCKTYDVASTASSFSVLPRGLVRSSPRRPGWTPVWALPRYLDARRSGGSSPQR